MSSVLEIAPQTASARGLTRGETISLAGSSSLSGFASLLNGILDANVNAIPTNARRDSSTARNERPFFRLQNRGTNAPRATGESSNSAPSTRLVRRKSGANAGPLEKASVHPEIQALFPTGGSEPPGGKGGTSSVPGRASASPYSMSSRPSQLAPSALQPRSSASALLPEPSLAKSPYEKAPATGDLAFALRLSWQPSSMRPGAAVLSVSDASALQAPETGLSNTVGASTVGDATRNQARPAADSNALSPLYKQGPPYEPPAPVAGAPDGVRVSSAAMHSTYAPAPIREELVAPVPPGALLQLLSSTPGSSPSETDAFGNLRQTLGNNTILDAALANTAGAAQAKTEEASELPERLPDKLGARTIAQTPEQDRAEPPSQLASDRPGTSLSARTLGADKQTAGPPPHSGNAEATHPASDPSMAAPGSDTAAGAGTKPAAKEAGNPPAQKLSPAPGNHDGAGMSADGVLLGRSTGPAGALGGRTKTVAPDSPQPAARTEAAPAPPAPSIRELSLRLGAATSSPVDVQLAAKAGKVQVAVRTPDVDLAKSLQTNLGELVGRLEEKGFKTEAWTPQTAVPSGLALRQPAASTANPGHSDSFGSPGGQQDARGGQRQPGHRRQERWQAHFEATLAAPDATSPASD